MARRAMESISDVSVAIKAAAMSVSERDAGFCSGGDEDDLSDLRSPSASEDSLEVQVTPISLKNKRKLVEPRKVAEPNPAPLKKRRFEGIEAHVVPDSKPTRAAFGSPSPFRPWSCANKSVDSKIPSTIGDPLSSSPNARLSAIPAVSEETGVHFRYRQHHRGDIQGDIVRRNDSDRVQTDADHRNADSDGQAGANAAEKSSGEALPSRLRRSSDARPGRCEKRDSSRQKVNTGTTSATGSAIVYAAPEATPAAHPRFQEEPLALVLRPDAAARVPSHPAVNGTYEKDASSYSVEQSHVSSSSSSSSVSRSSSSSSSCLSSLSSSSSSSSSLSSSSSSSSSSEPRRQEDHRGCGGNVCSTTGTATTTITTTTTTPTPTLTSVHANHAKQHASAAQQRNYKNMSRERRIEANARERTRVHTISAAFETLRRAIPAYSHNQKLSKLSVLRIACSYIMTLGKIVNTPEGEPANGASLGACVDLVSRTIQTEGKLRKRKED